jgi:hypothetical protein
MCKVNALNKDDIQCALNDLEEIIECISI